MTKSIFVNTGSESNEIALRMAKMHKSGFEILAVDLQPVLVAVGAVAIVLVLAARAISLGIPLFTFGLLRHRPRGTIVLLTWGGLRGGISVALALSLPAAAMHDLVLASTYMVVIFSILVQGLTMERVANRIRGSGGDPPPGPPRGQDA